jgi:hypothetical protein
MPTITNTTPLGRCPRCAAPVIEASERYGCEKSFAEVGACPFRISKVILGQIINREQVQLLLTACRSDLLTGFISKAGKNFPAFLVMDDAGKITFEFPPRVSEAAPESQAAPAHGRPAPEDPCKPLLQAATINLFKDNAFRITGIPVDATTRDVAKQGEKLKLMHELGQGGTTHQHAFPLSPPPTLQHIRDAIQQLKDPERRIIDEFFWFWPSEFGQGHTDPAVQALSKGDSQAALRLWQSSESTGQHAVIARHNLAIFWHLTALEWESKSLNGGVDETTLRDIRSYWQQAFRYWDDLLKDDELWTTLAARIRQIDDPRLPSGFARRMRAALPQAFAKINAELAISYVQSNKPELARFHVDFMRQTNAGLDDIESTAEVVLSPARKQLREQLKIAKLAADESPATASEAARSLLSSAKPILALFDLFHDKGHSAREDIFDEVAATCMQCAVAHQRTTSDNESFVSLLSEILPLAVSEDLRLRIQKNIGIGKGNLAHARLQPFRDSIRAIQNSKEPLRTKMLRMRNEILPRLKTYETEESAEKETLDQCFSDAAWAFRGLSIDAHNDDGDTETALELIQLAGQLARDADLQTKIAADLKQLTEIKKNKDSHNLLLQIRDDHIEINAKKVRYNSTTLPESDITGIRFGIFTQYTNGIKTSTSYTVGLLSTGHGAIDIECKRFFRSEDQAKLDFNAILNSLFYHVIPNLCTRIAKSIAAGHQQPLGDSWLTPQGIRATVGMLLWKEEVLVPWSDVRFGTHQGHLQLSSSQNKKFSKSYSLREAWNAVVFKQIAEEFMKLRK